MSTGSYQKNKERLWEKAREMKKKKKSNKKQDFGKRLEKCKKNPKSNKKLVKGHEEKRKREKASILLQTLLKSF